MAGKNSTQQMYVVHGTVRFIAATSETEHQIQIEPTGDYAKKYGGTRYTTFFTEPKQGGNPPEVKEFSIDHKYSVSKNSQIQDALMRAAFERTCLKIGIREDDQIVMVTVPAKDSEKS